MSTKKLWSVNGGVTWHSPNNKIYLPINNVYEIIFSEYNDKVIEPFCFTMTTTDHNKFVFYYDGAVMSGQNSSINLSLEEDNSVQINSSITIEGLDEQVNIN